MNNDRNSPEADGPSKRSVRYILNLEGKQAALAGACITANPYPPGQHESAGWLEGWAKATRERPMEPPTMPDTCKA